MLNYPIFLCHKLQGMNGAEFLFLRCSCSLRCITLLKGENLSKIMILCVMYMCTKLLICSLCLQSPSHCYTENLNCTSVTTYYPSRWINTCMKTNTFVGFSYICKLRPDLRVVPTTSNTIKFITFTCTALAISTKLSWTNDGE